MISKRRPPRDVFCAVSLSPKARNRTQNGNPGATFTTSKLYGNHRTLLRLHFLLYFKKRARKQGVEGGKKRHLPKLGERLQEMSYLDWPIDHEKKSSRLVIIIDYF